MSELLPCPFCGGEAVLHPTYDMDTGGVDGWFAWCDNDTCECKPETGQFFTEAEAIAAWNSRAAMEFDNWFYLPKPKEPIVEVTETTHAWDGTKVKTDVFYQVQEQAVINWAKELDEHIIKRICEIWNSRAERTCEFNIKDNMNETEGMGDVWIECSTCHCVYDYFDDDWMMKMSYCPNCGAKVVK